ELSRAPLLFGRERVAREGFGNQVIPKFLLPLLQLFSEQLAAGAMVLLGNREPGDVKVGELLAPVGDAGEQIGEGLLHTVPGDQLALRRLELQLVLLAAESLSLGGLDRFDVLCIACGAAERRLL